MAVRSQVKMDMAGNPIGLDFNAVHAMLQIYRVEAKLQKHIFHQVMKCYNWSVEIMKESKPKDI